LSASISAIRSHLFNAPRVRSLKTGVVSTLDGQTNSELILVIDAPTAMKRLHVFVSTQWLPSASSKKNPFTQYTATELGDENVRANMPSVTLGLQEHVITADQTGGWVELIASAGDLLSQAARPDDQSAYTHKLDLGAIAVVTLFNSASKHAWIRNVKALLNFDYVATGLPHAGDEVPAGERVFLDSVHAPSLIAGIIVPIAPLSPK
jgi:hypothetical protein